MFWQKKLTQIVSGKLKSNVSSGPIQKLVKAC